MVLDDFPVILPVFPIRISDHCQVCLLVYPDFFIGKSSIAIFNGKTMKLSVKCESQHILL